MHQHHYNNSVYYSPFSTMSTSTPTPDNSPYQVVFVHLDLGIGGAEQLVLSLAKASLQAGHDVQLVTCNCRQEHCFDEVKKPNGILSDRLHVWGNYIPPCILNMGTALCSSIRLLYLCFWTTRHFPNADLVVLDVLPTPIPLVLPYTSVLFYSHFPDKLLTRDTVNGQQIQQDQHISLFRQTYRSLLDTMEETTMGLADLLVVNSNFTKSMIQSTFHSLVNKQIQVLYPAIPCKDLERHAPKTIKSPIVSLNRFERKKNIELLLQAYALLQKDDSMKKDLPPLIVAGGYDVRNVENVEYMGELVTRSHQLGIDQNVKFLKSISDHVRSNLLQEALCVVYTPHLEHFGIVPLEAMAAGTPVVAVDSGGPKETVVHGVTGYRCEGCPSAFAHALQQYIRDPTLATKMGMAGRNHVVQQFSQSLFQTKWDALVQQAITQGRQRLNSRNYCIYKSMVYVMEAMLALASVLLLTIMLRKLGILQHDAHIVGSIQRAIFRNEL
jgi:glycosyltransferase involved in cell wall biosynthesis